LYARIRIGLLAAAASAIPLVATATAHEPEQPATPAVITEYYDGGHYGEDLDALTASATRSLKSQLKKKPRKPAIVFDIDDTLESTYECAKRSDFAQSVFTACIAQTDQQPIAQVWRLLRAAQKRKVAVFLITDRPVGVNASTVAQLKRDGLRGRYTLVERPDDEVDQPSQPYKRAARRAIQRRGYRILINIGDQESDLDGGFAVKRYKVPNPMYLTQ
jgi:predicted secreted acid phosphatase